ncbi:hypothetical protein BN1723_005575 [Verticillium longisporum]|uniref:t-SNARE coiled-coil homology domain-containing protein n=2 Tax=Verticillium longisporum TaxID=100787 RepID=A0A0G4NA50_VERLO|nr:hypothetical protein BN1723_005575 [Verticillium longisporum]
MTFTKGAQDALLQWANTFALDKKARTMDDFHDGILLSQILADLDTSYDPSEVQTEDKRWLANKKNLQSVYKGLARLIHRECPGLGRQARIADFRAIASSPDAQGICKLLALLFAVAMLGSNNERYVTRITRDITDGAALPCPWRGHPGRRSLHDLTRPHSHVIHSRRRASTRMNSPACHDCLDEPRHVQIIERCRHCLVSQPPVSCFQAAVIMSKPNQLFLLADHIKLSLLERQRAKSLNLDDDSQEGHISRSLDQFRDGLEALQEEQRRQTESGDASGAQSIADALPALQKQFSDLTSQFHGFPTPETTSTLTQPNDPSLSPDFAHAQSATAAAGAPRKTTLRSPSSSSTIPKTVRCFTDSAPSPSAADPALTAELFGPYRDEPSETEHRDAAAAAGLDNQQIHAYHARTVRFSDSAPSPSAADPALTAELFGPYRDEPSETEHRDATAGAGLDNQQIHAYHARVLREQDDHLDRLGESIGRQRELSMQIGDELDSHVAMLDDVDAATDRHQGRLDRARRNLNKVARSAGESKQMMTIIALIIILVLLIAVLK